MKKWMKTLENEKVKAFTLLEMLMVLLIISVLMLLFIPNLSKQKEKVTDKGNAAVVKIVENQAELYELNEGKKPNLSELVQNGNISDKQQKAYNDYYQKHPTESRNVS